MQIGRKKMNRGIFPLQKDEKTMRKIKTNKNKSSRVKSQLIWWMHSHGSMNVRIVGCVFYPHHYLWKIRWWWWRENKRSEKQQKKQETGKREGKVCKIFTIISREEKKSFAWKFALNKLDNIFSVDIVTRIILSE